MQRFNTSQRKSGVAGNLGSLGCDMGVQFRRGVKSRPASRVCT